MYLVREYNRHYLKLLRVQYQKFQLQAVENIHRERQLRLIHLTSFSYVVVLSLISRI